LLSAIEKIGPLKQGCGVAQTVALGLLKGRPEFESRLGTPEEALYRVEVLRRSRPVLEE
jgi:hypothetical protein